MLQYFYKETENAMNFFYEHLSDRENFFFMAEYHNCWVNSHFHKSYEFVYVISGRCEVFDNDKTSVIESGEIFCVPSYRIHFLKNIGDADILTLVFAENYFDGFVKDHGRKFFPAALTDKEKNRPIYEYMRSFYDKNGTDGGASFMKKQIFVNTLLCMLCDNYALEPIVISKHDQNICDILAYIDTHYSEKLSLNKLAEKFNYNPKYFSAYFNRLVGTNITGYINNTRFNNAKYLMENSDKSVSAIASECGFDSLATFYRVMKKYSEKAGISCNAKGERNE